MQHSNKYAIHSSIPGKSFHFRVCREKKGKKKLHKSQVNHLNASIENAVSLLSSYPSQKIVQHEKRKEKYVLGALAIR